MSWTAKFDTIDARALTRAFVRAGQRAIEATAQDMPNEQARLIHARQTPDGSPQQENATATKVAKMKRRGHDIPLKDSGRLADPNSWVVRRRGPGGWEVLPPGDRMQALARLATRGYRLIEFGEATRKTLRKNIDHAMRRVRKARFVRRG